MSNRTNNQDDGFLGGVVSGLILGVLVVLAFILGNSISGNDEAYRQNKIYAEQGCVRTITYTLDTNTGLLTMPEDIACSK